MGKVEIYGGHGMPDVVQTLKLCANDPMWADHAEVNKATLKRAIAEILELRAIVNSDRELVAQWMIGVGLATGHGDTIEDLLAEARPQIAELTARISKMESKIARAHQSVGSIQTARMGGDNLSIVLCSFFDKSDEPIDEEYGWGESAVNGCNEVLAALKEHYKL
jgi:hypothetical protein